MKASWFSQIFYDGANDNSAFQLEVCVCLSLKILMVQMITVLFQLEACVLSELAAPLQQAAEGDVEPCGDAPRAPRRRGEVQA